MPRSKQEKAFEYFVPLHSDLDGNTKYICKIGKCRSTLEGKNRFNLVSHIKSQHKEIYKLIDGTQSDENTMLMEIKRLELIQKLSEIVTVNGRAFAYLSDSGMIGLISNDFALLKERGYATGLYSPYYPAVRDHINYLAKNVIEKIKKETRGNFVSLMADVGTKNRKDILGIALQYIIDGRVIIRSIGMLELTASHTGKYIKDEIVTCLKVFDISPDQVISITTDNGSNMLAAVMLFNNEIADPEEPNGTEIADECDDATDEFEITSESDLNNEIVGVLAEFDSAQENINAELQTGDPIDPEVLQMLDDTSHFLDLLQELENEFATQTLKSNGVKCAAHVLQLAVKDALKISSILTIIKICRTVCKLLRKKTNVYDIRAQNLNFKEPRLDCSTRWSSTYLMVISFIILCIAYMYAY